VQVTLFAFIIFINFTFSQTPESYFPSNVGNVWQYQGELAWMDWRITRDSISNNGDILLFGIRQPPEETLLYRVDTHFNVYVGTSRLYDLKADSGDAWVYNNNGFHNYYGWVAQVDSGIFFGRQTTVKVIRYGPIHPDSGGNDFYYTERYLASGFGLIYEWDEPGNISRLKGCVVGADTFGTVVSVKKDKENFPKQKALLQNYPNPFNPTTDFRFQISHFGFVSLKVYDIFGRELATLVSKNLEAGNYEQSWNARNFSSGIYYYRINVIRNGISLFNETKKLLLMK